MEYSASRCLARLLVVLCVPGAGRLKVQPTATLSNRKTFVGAGICACCARPGIPAGANDAGAIHLLIAVRAADKED